jgi:hypothetical protein
MTTRSMLLSTLATTFVIAACSSGGASGTNGGDGGGSAPSGSVGSSGTGGATSNGDAGGVDSSEEGDGDAGIGGGDASIGDGDAGNGDGGGGTVLRDCPPCWQELFCWVPPDLGDNFLMLGASDGRGGCTLTPELDSGESLTVPLECGGPSNHSVPWSVGTYNGDPTIVFNIPSKGIVNCDQS